MSTVNVRPSTNAAGAVGYILYGRDPEVRRELLRVGSTRAAAYAMFMVDGGSTPAEFIACAEAHAAAHGRTNQLQSYVLAFHPDEFDATAQADLERIRDVAVELAERMHSADYMVAVHSDSAGGHGHAHILVINHDNLTGKSLQRYTSWKHGLRQLNDELMADEGLRVLPDPAEPKPDWELRREGFAPGGFEQALGDKVYDALTDSRSTNREAFEHVLAEHGVTLAVTNRDGWSYKMRRDDNGKLGRKKASGLTPEFTARTRHPQRRSTSVPMGALDKLKEADDQQKATELLEVLISKHDADRQQIERLTKTVADLTGYVKVMDEELTKRMDRLSTSQQLELPSTLPLDAETRKRLNEIEKTLSAVAQQLSSSEVVKLPDESSVTRADLDAHTMTKKINEELRTTASASADLAEAVRKRGNVRIDTDKLTERAVKVLDQRLAKAVEAPVQRVEKTVAGLEERVSKLGTEKLAEVTGSAHEVVNAVGRTERRVEQLSAKVTWAAVGRMCLALIPFIVAFIMLTGMVGGITQMLGLGPLLGWAWDSFAAASAWWTKALIALAALGGCALFGWLLWWLGKKLYESYRGW